MRRIWLAILLLAASTAPGRAQGASTGSIVGRVVDSSATAVVAATITSAWSDGSYRRVARSAGDGSFTIDALPPGRYDLSVQRVGFRPSLVRDVRVVAGGASRLTVTLARAATELAPVVVQTPTVAIRRGDTQFETRIDETAINALPVGLDVDRVVAFTPGARPAQLWGGATAQANNYQLDGVAMNHTGVGGRFFEPNVDWLEQVEVRGLGAGAEYGDFQGGLVDFVTKSGSNTPQGFVRAHLQTDRLDATNLTPTVIVPELANRQDVEAEHRGAIIRDKLFYYVSGQLLNSDFRAVNHQPLPNRDNPAYSPVTQSSVDHKTFAKLSYTASTSDLFTLSAGHLGTATSHFGLTGRESADATSRYNAPVFLYGASWDRALGRFGSAQLKVGGVRDQERVEPYNGPDVPGISTYQVANARDYQNAPFTERRDGSNTDVSFMWHASLTTAAVEQHLKAGIQRSWGGWSDERLRNGGMTWRPRYYSPVDAVFDPANASTWDAQIPFTVGGEVRLHTHVRNRGEFLEDEMTAGRFTLTPGVRWGQWLGRIAAPDGVEYPAVQTSGIDPRLGLVVDLSRRSVKGTDPTFVVKAHWGRYHQGMFGQLFDRAAQGSPYTDQYFWEYEGPKFANSDTTFTAGQIAQLAAQGKLKLLEHADLDATGRVTNFKQPYVDQIVVGLEKTIRSRFKIEGVFIRRDNFDQPGLVDRNAATNWTAFTNVRLSRTTALPSVVPPGGLLPDQNGNPLTMPVFYVPNDAIIATLREYARLLKIDGALAGAYRVPGFSAADTATLSWNPDYVLTSLPNARRRFEQVQLNLTYDGPRTTAALSLALTSLRGNFASVTGYDDNTIYGRDGVVGRGPGPYVRPNEAINYDGRLENYSPFEAKLRLTHPLPWRIDAGLFASMTTGDPVTPSYDISQFGFAYTTNRDTLPLGLVTSMAGQRIYTAQRGAYQYRPHGSVDLHFERPLGRARRTTEDPAAHQLTLTLDAFNILNDRTPIQENTDLDAQVDPNAAVKYGAPLQRADPRRFRFGGIIRF